MDLNKLLNDKTAEQFVCFSFVQLSKGCHQYLPGGIDLSAKLLKVFFSINSNKYRK